MNLLEGAHLPGAVVKPKGALQDCPLCGFRFSTHEAACSGCTFLGGCSMLKCPNCQYEFVVESKIVRWFEKMTTSLRGVLRKGEGRRSNPGRFKDAG